MRASAALLLALACACTEAPAQEKGAGFDDAMISERVAHLFDTDPMLKDMRIWVETRDRVVHLSGFVYSMAQLQRAEALARRIEGVASVRNAVRVADRPSRA
ncbi:MAG TPA: BON domain-containing protein [Burkholderiales bacterium]|nr:BON domain-containing protein [Burkholderiales bacterium]